jgi:hypothetical protein
MSEIVQEMLKGFHQVAYRWIVLACRKRKGNTIPEFLFQEHMLRVVALLVGLHSHLGEVQIAVMTEGRGLLLMIECRQEALNGGRGAKATRRNES